MLTAGLLAVTAFVSSWFFTGQFRRYAVARQLVDRPNARSSHSTPTPRGGGMAIVVTVLFALPILVWLGSVSLRHGAGIAGGGLTAALVGFVDDHRPVHPAWRLAGHFGAAAWVVLWGVVPSSEVIFGVAVSSSVLIAVISVLYVVWLVNLTNFMDGIDGLAATEVVTSCAWGIVFCRVAAPSSAAWLVPLVMGAAALGFLRLNWPPAKVFLGDGGSGFLGFMLASLTLHAGWIRPRLLWSWIIVLGVFVVDATVTLLRRLVSGATVHQAHRSHAYQHAALRFASHRRVTLAAAAITLFWLGPLGFLVSRDSIGGAIALIVAYAPLIAIAYWFGAGKARLSPVEQPSPFLVDSRPSHH